jgi:hypothetical protein
MAGLSAAADLLVDRYYRGAIVMTGTATFAIPEAAIALVETVLRAPSPYRPAGEDELLLADVLIARGILIGSSR